MKNSVQTIQIQDEIESVGKRAKLAATILAGAAPELVNKALREAASLIIANQKEILESNQLDIKIAQEKHLDAAMIDRLLLDAKRIESISNSVIQIAEFPSPLGKELGKTERPSGIVVSKISVALGVIGIIYESRPNVTVDASALCLKAGNSVILKCGSESYNSSSTLLKFIRQALLKYGLPEDAVQLLATNSREAVALMLQMDKYIDVIIPRGGKGLCELVRNTAKVPTLLHLDGNCHSYIHEKADADIAVNVVANAKMRRTGICGATESLVVDRKVKDTILPKILKKLDELGCKIIADNEALLVAKAHNINASLATEDDWYREYLAAVISVKIVAEINEAISHINKYGSHHTDAIITEDQNAKATFIKNIDSAIVMHNTSTQFADGGEFGMGAEIGIATGRLHARGPVGANELTTYKYVVTSDGSVRK